MRQFGASMRKRLLISVLLGFSGLQSAAHAEIVRFQDDFEGGNLSQWTGKSGGSHHGQIVTDPLNPSNRVLNFTSLNAAGDMFSASAINLTSFAPPFVLSFDYLGLPQVGFNPDDTGGFIGISLNLNPQNIAKDHAWLAGTNTVALGGLDFTGSLELIDDGTWHHYEIDFTSIVTTKSLTSIFVMVEDWNFRGLPEPTESGLAGDAYFDNITLTATPEPSTLFLGTIAILGTISYCRQRRKTLSTQNRRE